VIAAIFHRHQVTEFLITAQRREMIMSKTMSRVVPGLALAVAIVASTAAIRSKAEAAGDAAAGEHVFARCLVCHSPKAGENKIGPSLAGVFGPKSGRHRLRPEVTTTPTRRPG
jgi:cytochrome c2